MVTLQKHRLKLTQEVTTIEERSSVKGFSLFLSSHEVMYLTYQS